MQGQRSTVQFFPEAFDFDHASSSSSSAVDRQVYWNNMLNPGDARSTQDYLLSRVEPNMSYRNVFGHEAESLSGWNIGGPSSSEPMMNLDNHDASEMEVVWTSSLTDTSEIGPRFDERRLDAASMLSLDSMAMNLGGNQISQGQTFLRSSGSTGFPNIVDCNAGITGNGGQVPQRSICSFYNPFSSEGEDPCAIDSSNSDGISASDGLGHLAEDGDGRPESLLDSRRLSGKRKNIEGAPGTSSGSSNNICFQQTENSLLHTVPSINISSSNSNIYLDSLSSVHPPEECLNPRFIAGTRGGVSECLPSITIAGNSEVSQRNFRLRMNPAQQADSSVPNLWSLGNSSMNHSVWSPHQSSSVLYPVNQPLEMRPAIPSTSSQSQSRQPMIPGLPRMVHPCMWNVPSRIGSSSNSHVISGERLAALREETNLRGLQRNSILEQPMFVPANEVRRVGQDHANWSLVNGNISIPGNVASTSLVGSTSGVHPSMASTWTPHQSPHHQYQQASSEFVYRAFPATVSDPGGQLNNYLAQQSSHSSSPEPSPPPGVGLRTHHQAFPRPAFLMGRRSNVMGAPLTSRTLTAAREGRNVMIYEHIRNALDRMRRGMGVRFEDVLVLDQSAIFEAADLHDRHRDMRLDIDDMSYEELLALEERIGNVNTGLSEEAILKRLKLHKYLSISLASSGVAEPCCICQEEYFDGEDLGTLDCGHDFHMACIKQWLTHKNVCPICKMTGLAA